MRVIIAVLFGIVAAIATIIQTVFKVVFTIVTLPFRVITALVVTPILILLGSKPKNKRLASPILEGELL
jgi:ABC-type Fe3+-siderophore transport system permease subunit